MALVFVAGNNGYARVKNYAIRTGFLTKCVTVTDSTNRNDLRRRGVACKIVIQKFAMLGYDPWGLQLNTGPIPTMVVDLDILLRKNNEKFIHASVFSINLECLHYQISVNVTSGENKYHFVNMIRQSFTAAINTFMGRFNTFPKRFIIYRYGVEESYLGVIQEIDTETLLSIVEIIYEGPVLPQIIDIVVNERISDQFIMDGNIPKGTIIDKSIVKPFGYGFYLASQGMATPTSYDVLMNTGYEAPIPPSQLQHITYAQTHICFNWMGTIRVPVPVYYAHRLAELVGTIHRGTNPFVISDRIRESLFYLYMMDFCAFRSNIC